MWGINPTRADQIFLTIFGVFFILFVAVPFALPNDALTGIIGIISGGTGSTTAWGALNNLLPNQSGNSGKYLTTDGNNASWASVSQNASTPTTANITGSFYPTGIAYATNASNLKSSSNLTYNGTHLTLNGTLQIRDTNIINIKSGTAGSVDRLDISAVQGNRGAQVHLIPAGTGVFSKLTASNQNSTSNFGSIFIGAEGNTGWINPQQVGTPTTNLTILRIGGLPTTAGGTNWSEIHMFGRNISFRANGLRIADISNTFQGALAAAINGTTTPAGSSLFGTAFFGLPNGHLFLDVLNNDLKDSVIFRFNNTTATHIGAFVSADAANRLWVNGSINWTGELLPEGQTCLVGQAPYRAAANAWACFTPLTMATGNQYQIAIWNNVVGQLQGDGNFMFDYDADTFLAGASTSITQPAMSANWQPALTVNAGEHMEMDSGEYPDIYFNLARSSSRTGANPVFNRAFLINQPEYKDSGAGYSSYLTTMSITGTPKVQGSFVDDVIGLDIEAGEVSTGGTPVNAYGLRVGEPIGATNNYAAQLNGKVNITSALFTADTGSLSCASDTRGSLGYNYASNYPCYCDGSSWLRMTGGMC